MEQNCLAGAQKSGLRSRTLYRVAAVGIATLITQAFPGGAASSWGIECLTTDLANNSYCVTSLSDDIPSGSAAWTLRKSVEDANTRAATSATIGFQDALFGIQRNDQGQVTNQAQTPLVTGTTPGESTNPTNEGKIVLGSTLEIKTNITITAPTDADGRILLTIERGTGIASGAPLISVNPTPDPATVPATDPTTVPAANQATTEVKIENVTIQSRANQVNPQDASGSFATPGVAIQVASTTVPGDNVTTVTPDVVLKSSQVLNAVSESGGAAINTPGNVRVEGSTLDGNVAITSTSGAPTDGGAIKADGTVTVTSSALNNNSATGNGGAISATTVIVANTPGLQNSQLIGNTAAGSGGAISASGSVTVAAGSSVNGNTAGVNGGAISTGSTVEVNNSTVNGNKATAGSGGAISATGAVTVVASSKVDSNTAGSSGGAISSGDQVTVSASTLNNNTAELGTGGAISAIAYTAVSISGSELKSNSASLSGGAIAARGPVTVSTSTLNSNTSEFGTGGAISTVLEVTVSASTLNNNTAEGSGGAIFTIISVAVSESSTVSNNIAKDSGGAIKALGAVTVSTSTLNGNTATIGDGGAISAREVTVSASTLTLNKAEIGSGGAISTVVSATVFGTSTVSNNTAKDSGGAIKAGNNVSVFQSTLSGNTATTGNGGAISATGVNSTVEVSASHLNYNEALEGKGGAIFSAGKVITSSEAYFEENSAEFGGAIAATTLVNITDTVFIYNSATESGGAILVDSESNEESTISKSTFAVNSAEFGGAIYAGAAIKLSETEFFSNTAFESGGAIYAEGNVAVIDSVFGINIESDVEAQEEPETQSNVAYLGQGGAIYSEGKVTTTRSAFVRNFSGSGGGAIAAEQTVSVNGSIFVGNGSFGDGGAVYATGGVIVENGSVLLANTAGVNPESEFGFGFLYPIFLDGPVYFDMEISGGNGGAIYSEGDVRVSGSNIGAAPPGAGAGFTLVFANKALCAQSFWQDGDESGWDQECEFYEYNDNSQFGNEYSEVASVGNGGGIYALGKVTIEGGNTTINIDLDVLSLLDIFIAKEVSFEQSYLTNNYAQNNGGAVYALGGVRVDNAVFGTKPVENPNYNPERRYRNLYYVPARTESNPLFNNGELPRTPNDLYDLNIPSLIPNPSCEGVNEFWGNGFTGESGCVVDGSYHPTSIENPDTGWIIDFPNPLYSNEPNLYIEAEGEEFVYLLDEIDMDYNPYKFVYTSNSSGHDGGAIYVEGSTLITKSTFSGNTSEEDGGAIYSKGTLQIEDSSFDRNWAGEDGGAIDTNPGDGDLFITRTSFTDNVAMDDGGAIDISTGTVEHYDDVILSSLFRGNEAFGPGGAIDSGYVVLILNTFEENKSLEGASLNLSGGYLSGNVLIGAESEQDLCLIDISSRASDNFATDESCFGSSGNYVLPRGEITAEEALHTLPTGYEATLLEELKGNEEFFLEVPSVSDPDGVLSPFGTFITNELNKDFKSEVRDSAVLWTAGHLQRIFPSEVDDSDSDSVDNSVDNSVGESVGESEIGQPKDKNQQSQDKNSGVNNQVVINQSDSTNLDSPILVLQPVLSAEELARISQLRAEQLAAELLRQKEAERIAAENVAKIKAAKLARDKARALAAEKRRAQLAALKAKIAATQARGEALKQKSSWINLMKNSLNSKAAKKLVMTPTK